MVVEDKNIENEIHLSKTSFLHGKRCLKALYLHHNHRVAPRDTERGIAAHKGKRFESRVHRALFRDGVNLKEQLGNSYKLYPEYTNDLLKSNDVITLFEAGISHSRQFALLDVLCKDEQGLISIFEIKKSRHLKNGALWDATFQYSIAKKVFGDRLKEFNLILEGRNQDFKIMKVQDQLEKKLDEVQKKVNEYLSLIDQAIEPSIKMGKQCESPYSCKFSSVCIG